MRLLLVEDNARLAILIAKLLSDNGFAVDVAETADTARASIESAKYDLVLLDLGLPDADGTDILRRLRTSRENVPVLVITARSEVIQRVALLNAGADDYLVKPFSLEELVARIRAILRRPPDITDVLSAGNIVLDMTCLSLTIDGDWVDLPRREMGVLETLLRSQGRLVPKEKLAQAIYTFDDEFTPNAVEVAVSRLRRRLKLHGATVAVTAMRGLGYVLTPA